MVGRSCLIFAHDGDENFDLSCACVLDTELLTLRNCGNMLAPPTDANFPPDLPKCAFSVVGFKTCFFPKDASMRIHLEHAWVIDTNLGMVRKGVTCAAGTQLPAPAQCVLQVVGDSVVIFAHDDRQRLDLASVCVLECEGATVRRVAVEGDAPAPAKCVLLVVEKCVLVIPEQEDLSRVSQVCDAYCLLHRAFQYPHSQRSRCFFR